MIREIEPGKAAIADLKDLLTISSTSPELRQGQKTLLFRGKHTVHIRILGHSHPAKTALIAAMNLKAKVRYVGQQSTPGRACTVRLENGDENREGFANAVWRSAMLRVASRPVDMVFSIMGLFGMTLDPGLYGVNDRVQATIRLMQGVMRMGGRAEWLGISPGMPLNNDIGTMPVFPKFNPLGSLIIETPTGEMQVATMIGNGWELCDAPRGTVSDDGYLRFSARAAPARIVQHDEQTPAESIKFKSLIGQEWQLLKRGGPNSYYAVFIGTKEQYSHASPRYVDLRNHLVMLVKEDGLGRFHNLGYAYATKDTMVAELWSEQEFNVG